MEKSIQNLIKKIKKNKKIHSLKKQDEKEGVKATFCSCFVPELNMLVRGEYNNLINKSRNAKILITNCKIKELKGKKINVLKIK